MTCDGGGKLPCTCGAEAYRAGGREAPCSCNRRCDGCTACGEADAAEEAEREASYRDLDGWYHAKIGTAPPRAKAVKGEGKPEAKDQQGRMF